MSLCPCCHQPMKGKANLHSLSSIPLPTVARTIVNGLSAAYPRAVAAQSLVDNIYHGVKNGGPRHARQALSVQITRLRDKLPMYGWTIPRAPTGKGNTAFYRLCPVADLDDRYELQPAP